MFSSGIMKSKLENLDRLQKIIDPENGLVQSIECAKKEERYTQWNLVEKNHSKELASHKAMMAALKCLAKDAGLQKGDYAKSLDSILNAAAQHINYFWLADSIRNDQHFNDEMLLLTQTIDLLHNTVNGQEFDTTEFLRLFSKLSDYANIDAKQLQKSEDRAKKFERIGSVLLGIGFALMAAAIIASIVVCFTLGAAALIPCFLLAGCAALLIFGKPGGALIDKGRNIKHANSPQVNLVRTFFAAESTAKVCEIVLPQKKEVTFTK